ncbi:hypothetical protein TPHA_0A00590 [Tetrapisispora phaffii CBS 4417]|uniref:NAD-dependent epimerase/dehydratase domain-containing protein n=1 Tax=Tetrapisispora phaffii (strain ATCC 24235 / CBS 4417 / NBRC 1672 / NRRL Y-8282 / UCD 70-5) TaxID=1071381 RepID=G8BML6_TETPH|nr:hypothetical protein TPHA_0A00590 [Tetrapisispora phaffii CBS 4417]CCE61144.1 hypothetical protein TPHA_0A00590 [Tetrapisispora phaffii CBS 4417]
MSVLVTGASGFIALHVINQLLEQNYKVIGTVRSEAKAEKLNRQFNNPNLTIEIAPDIANLDAFDEVLKKHSSAIDAVIHMASPLPSGNTDYETHYLIPALNGVKGIMNSIKKYAPHSVKRFVLTSSLAAIIDLKKMDGSEIFNEKSWNPITWEEAQTSTMMAYCGSKTFAEKAAWEFLKENKDIIDFQMVVINPGVVYGAQLFAEDVGEHLNGSCESANKLLHTPADVKETTKYEGEFIHVYDVAKAHVLAIQREDLVGKRLLLTNHGYSHQSSLNSMNKQFPQLKGVIPPYVSGEDEVPSICDSSVTKKLLGFPFKTYDEALYDLVHQVLKKEGRL